MRKWLHPFGVFFILVIALQPAWAGAASSPSISSKLTQFFKAVESVPPEGFHPANLRAFEVEVGGNPIIVALLANPIDRGSEPVPEDEDHIVFADDPDPDGVPLSFSDCIEDEDAQDEKPDLDYRDAIRKLQVAGCQTLFSFCSSERKKIIDEWLRCGEEREEQTDAFAFDFPDFTPPKSPMMNRVYEEVKIRAAARKQAVAFCCGSGFGRSGVLVASLVLRQLFDQSLDDQVACDLTCKVPIELEDGSNYRTTELVKRAIFLCRQQDPENGNVLLRRNGRASPKGPTVETCAQIDALVGLQRRLVRSSQRVN